MALLDNYLKQIGALSHTAGKSAAWLKAHEKISSDLNKALSGFNDLVFAIPIFGGSADKYTDIQPWHHIFFEAEQDLDSSIILLLTGFYKDSFRSMRSFLELYILALYYFVNEDKNSFKNWLQGKTDTPRFSELLRTLSEKNKKIKTLNQNLKWNTEVRSLYKELSGFMHTGGALRTHTSLRNSNMTSFSEIGIETGVEFLLKVIRLTGMVFVVNFPMSFQPLPLFDKFAFNQPAGGFLEDDQVDRIKAIFQDDILKELSAIPLSDDDSISLADCVRSMPDLSEQEIFDSLMKTLESDPFTNSKERIFKMISDNKFEEAFTYVRAIQRAMMRTMTMVLFNPFHDELSVHKNVTLTSK
jgi:hypothetical protein